LVSPEIGDLGIDFRLSGGIEFALVIALLGAGVYFLLCELNRGKEDAEQERGRVFR
jgi:hypothetical protein